MIYMDDIIIFLQESVAIYPKFKISVSKTKRILKLN